MQRVTYKQIGAGGHHSVFKRVTNKYDEWLLKQRREQEEAKEEAIKGKYEAVKDIYDPIRNIYKLNDNYAVEWADIVKLDAIYKGKGRLSNTNIADVIKGHNIYERILDMQEGETKQMGTLRGCMNDLLDVYAGARVKLLEAMANRDELYSQWRRIERDYTIDRTVKVSAEAEYIKAKEKVDELFKEVSKEVKEESEKIRQKMNAYADKYYRIDPNKLDANTVKLLESGALSLEDIKVLANNNAENYTMLKLLQKCANDMGTTEAHILANEISALSTNNVNEIFEQTTRVLDRGISRESAKVKAGNQFLADNQQSIIEKVPNFEIAED